MRQTCIFSGSSHPWLVEAICDRLGMKPAKVDLKKFSNGETSVEIKTSVRDQDVFIVQSGSDKINDNVMELLIMIAACKGGSARSITAVMPYFPYSRQSKRKTHRGAITARMLANLMSVAGVSHVITIDLHASQMQGFFKCPVDNLVAEPIIAKWIRSNIPDWQDAVVVSKNAGGTKRVTSLADALKLSFGIVTTDRRRPRMGDSMHGSMIFEPMGSDGTNTRQQLEDEVALQRAHAAMERPSSRSNRSFQLNGAYDGDDSPLRPSRHRTQTSQPLNFRNRLVNGSDVPSSPLAQAENIDDLSDSASHSAPSVSLRRVSTVPTVARQAADEDGYESPDEEGSVDQRARDVITGRLIHGHIVDDDDVPSPTTSSSYHAFNSTRRSSEDEDGGDHMMASFISTTSRRREDPAGLGGTADAAASDEEEEEALKDPEIDMTITLVGNVKDKSVLIVDDMIDKSGSWIAAAETVVKRGGARRVYLMATHGLFGNDCLEELEECTEVDHIIVTDAYPIPEHKRANAKKLTILDVSVLLAESIRRNHYGESISQLYQHFD